VNSPAAGGQVDLDELAALEEQRRFLLTSLDDLEREHAVGDLDDDDYETLRADYTARAARVIEAIENRQELIDATDPGHRPLRRVMAVVAVVAVAVVAGIVVTSTSGSRRHTAESPGTLTPSKATQACIDEMGATFGSATSSGTDFASNAVATLRCFTDRLGADPDDVVALTYRGRTEALLAQQLEGVASAADVANFASRAHADLSRALELAPEYPDALAFAAIAAVQEGDVASARKFLARIDALQLPGNNSILPIVNNVIRPAVEGAGTTTTTAPADGAPTSAPRTSAPPG
jgi:hypothetical protein